MTPDETNGHPEFWSRILTGAYSAATFAGATLYSWWAQRRGQWPHAGVEERWGRSFPPADVHDPIWIHAASMGEVRVAGLFAHELIRHGPSVVVSSMTEPGYQLCGEVFPPGTTRVRVPFDLPGPVERTLAHFHPRALVLVETEWWPNLLTGCARADVPVFIINGRISERAFRRYRMGRSYWASLLRAVSFFYMSSEDDADRLRRLGVDSSRMAAFGSLKAGNFCVLPQPHAIPASPNVPNDSLVWIAGCTRPGEEEIILQAYRILQTEFPKLHLWLAPRHPDRFDRAVALVSRVGFRCVRWSAASPPARLGMTADTSVVVIDQMGVLASLYVHAAVAFIGGSLKPYGGHNPLEPAFAGAPVVFGPHMEDQSDAATLLLSLKLATTVHDPPSLAAAVADYLRHPITPALRHERIHSLTERFSEIRARVASDLCARLPRLHDKRGEASCCAAGRPLGLASDRDQAR